MEKMVIIISRRLLMAAAIMAAVIFSFSLFYPGLLNQNNNIRRNSTNDQMMMMKKPEEFLQPFSAVRSRKLLNTDFSSAAAPASEQEEMVEPNRIWGEKCSKSDIIVNQGSTSPLPNGIPTYTVEIMNVCVSGCDISRIHLSCGWFSSARLINPRLFKRIRYDDCIVNDGKPLPNGATLSFQYANTFRYPLSVSSVTC
ncbi:hypothetical protein MKW98_013874 [Papaver atlanticum]|uniref:Uncharacterized protein n=1 Tax=Papaver atlanticum TaxID=357466 RepID=A0AAD4T956_9MAGN|nr:hypothetical protein MKW98_013874 [Papaver atlanticum]